MEQQARHRIPIILLAAGKGTRFGGPKQLAIIGNQPMVRFIAVKLKEVNAGPVVVVTGAYSMEVRNALGDIDVEISDNPDWEKGVSSSIMNGLQYVEQNHPDADGLLVALADQPFLNVRDYAALISAFDKDHIVAASYGKEPGVPVIFPKRFWPILESLSGDVGAAVLLRERSDVKLVEVQDLRDIDRNDQL